VNRITLEKIEGVSVLGAVGVRAATIPGRVPRSRDTRCSIRRALSLESAKNPHLAE